MKTNEDELKSVGCPICASKGTIPIEFDEPVVLLCECGNCRKFIVKKETLKLLELRRDFKKNRNRISSFMRYNFEKSHIPLEIISKDEVALTKNQITIEEILGKIC